jgi:hypothetical protein
MTRRSGRAWHIETAESPAASRSGRNADTATRRAGLSRHTTRSKVTRRASVCRSPRDASSRVKACPMKGHIPSRRADTAAKCAVRHRPRDAGSTGPAPAPRPSCRAPPTNWTPKGRRCGWHPGAPPRPERPPPRIGRCCATRGDTVPRWRKPHGDVPIPRREPARTGGDRRGRRGRRGRRPCAGSDAPRPGRRPGQPVPHVLRRRVGGPGPHAAQQDVAVTGPTGA